MTASVSESKEQAVVIQWFRAQYPRAIILSLPNGSFLAGDAQRRAIQMARMKREGLMVGAADLFVARPIPGGASGLFCEMKSLDGRASPAQLAFGKAVVEAGYWYEVCHGADAAITVIRRYMAMASLA